MLKGLFYLFIIAVLYIFIKGYIISRKITKKQNNHKNTHGTSANKKSQIDKDKIIDAEYEEL